MKSNPKNLKKTVKGWVTFLKNRNKQYIFNLKPSNLNSFNMKKVLVSLAIATVFASCGGDSTKTDVKKVDSSTMTTMPVDTSKMKTVTTDTTTHKMESTTTKKDSTTK